jgi:hypothetical protein
MKIVKVDKVKIATKLKNKANLAVKVLKLSIGVQIADPYQPEIMKIVKVDNVKIATKWKNKANLAVKVLKLSI